MSVVNWTHWHQKMQHLFRAALYNKWKYKKCAVPLPQMVGRHVWTWNKIKLLINLRYSASLAQMFIPKRKKIQSLISAHIFLIKNFHWIVEIIIQQILKNPEIFKWLKIGIKTNLFLIIFIFIIKSFYLKTFNPVMKIIMT